MSLPTVSQMQNDDQAYFKVQEIADGYDVTKSKAQIKEAQKLMRAYHKAQQA